MEQAIAVLEDCLVAGDNPEQALATVADDYEVSPSDLAAAFKAKFGKSYLHYSGN